MKKIILIAAIISSAVIFHSCRKDDNPKLPDLMKAPVPVLELSENSTTIIEDDDQKANFTSTFSLKLYFDDVKPSSYDIVATKNGDYSDVRVLAGGLTEIPGTVEVSTQNLAELFGMTMDEMVTGTYFEVRAQFTMPNGVTIPAFSTTGEAYSSDLKNLPGSSLTLKYQIVCPLDLSTFVGQFTVEDPDMWEGTYPVTITREGEDQLRVSGWFEDATNSFIINVDQANRTVTIPYQVFHPGEYLFGYHDWAIEGKGEIDACTNSLSIDFETTVAEGSFGTYNAQIHP